MAETWVLSVSNMCIITLPYCRFRDSYSTAAPQILCWHGLAEYPTDTTNAQIWIDLRTRELTSGKMNFRCWATNCRTFCTWVPKPMIRVCLFVTGMNASSLCIAAYYNALRLFHHIPSSFWFDIVNATTLKWFCLQSPCCRLRCVSQRLVVEPIIMKACMAKLGNLPPTNKRTE
jgi:hypothetical protein